MRKVVLVIMLALAATPVAAQQVEGLHSTTAPKDPAKAAKEKQIDAEYRKALNGIPNAKASSDPWGNVRQAPSSTKAPSR